MEFFDKLENKSSLSIREAALILCNRIFETAVMNAKDIEEFCNNKSDENIDIDVLKFWKLIFEFQFLFLHIIDRKALNLLGQKIRLDFMDILVELTIDSTINVAFKDIDEINKDALKSSMINDYNRSQIDYAKCRKMFAEDNESKKDTLFWEFGKKIAEIINQQMGIIYIMASIEIAVNSLNEIRINDILEKI